MTPQLQNDSPRTGSVKGNTTLRIGYILCYRDPNYIRSHSLLQALRANPEITVTVACNTHKGLRRYVETWLALRRIRKSRAPDIYVLGFRGHEIFWAIHMMIHGKPLIFDAMMSPYAALCEENKAGLLGKLLAPIVYRMERRILQRSHLVLTDTRLHASYYARTFSIPQAKLCTLPVGAIESTPNTALKIGAAAKPFSVLFYGSFLPLHGVPVIAAAAALLKDLPIRFDFIGGNAKQAQQLQQQCAQRDVTRYTHRQWVPLEQLLQSEIPHAGLCLGGPFGGTAQARRVVTGKASQCLALSKATVIGRIEEDYGFVDRVNCLLVEQADANALADAIRWAYENRAQLFDIGQQGRLLYDARLSIKVIAERLLPRLRCITMKPQLTGSHD